MLGEYGCHEEQKRLLYCPNCGIKLEGKRLPKYCPNCGTALYSFGDSKKINLYDEKNEDNMVPPSALKVSPEMAALLSLIVTGLGQMINGQPEKGIAMLLISIVGLPIIGAVLGSIIWLVAIIYWIGSAIDAYQCSLKLKEGERIKKFAFFGE